MSPVQEAVTVQSLPTQDYIQSLTDTVAVIDENLQAIERQQRHFFHVRCSNFAHIVSLEFYCSFLMGSADDCAQRELMRYSPFDFIAGRKTYKCRTMQRTEQHVEVLSKSRWSLVWWKSLHVLAVVGAVLVHRALLTNTPQRAPASSTSDAVLV